MELPVIHVDPTICESDAARAWEQSDGTCFGPRPVREFIRNKVEDACEVSSESSVTILIRRRGNP